MVFTRLERMIAASRRLPEDLRGIFQDAFVAAKSDEQICSERGISIQELEALRVKVVRNLRAASV